MVVKIVLIKLVINQAVPRNAAAIYNALEHPADINTTRRVILFIDMKLISISYVIINVSKGFLNLFTSLNCKIFVAIEVLNELCVLL